MKKIHFSFRILCLALAFVISSCGGKGSESADNSGSPEIKVPAAMTDFMGMLKGKSDATDAAINKYASEGLDKKDMYVYDLKDPKVVSADKDCCTMEAKSGMTTRTYVLCWEAGKIKSIEDKGMK